MERRQSYSGPAPDPYENQPHGQLSADVAVLLVSMSLCVPCIVARTGASEETVRAVLRDFERTVTVTILSGRCEGCGREAQIYRTE